MGMLIQQRWAAFLVFLFKGFYRENVHLAYLQVGIWPNCSRYLYLLTPPCLRTVTWQHTCPTWLLCFPCLFLCVMFFLALLRQNMSWYLGVRARGEKQKAHPTVRKQRSGWHSLKLRLRLLLLPQGCDRISLWSTRKFWVFFILIYSASSL